MPSRQEQPDWDKHAIKAEIYRRGETLSSIALRAGISPVTCRAALIQPQPSADRAISKVLGVKLHVLWPDRYDRHGNRLLSRSKTTRVAGPRTSQKGRAA